MKTVKYIISLLLLMLAATLPAQVVEFNRLSYPAYKQYIANIDSIVYIPAQDWNISANVDSYYEDSQSQEVHAIISVTVGPNAEIARAGFSSTRDESELDIKLSPGTTQTIDVVVPDPKKPSTFILYTRNKYHMYSDYYTSITIDYTSRDWEDIGTALYREDLMTTFWGVDNIVYSVSIQKSKDKEGYYRLVNPYGAAYPYNGYGDYDANTTGYMTINATDPDRVYVEESPTTMDWGYGVISMQSYVSYLLSSGSTLEEIKATRPDIFGKLKNGTISMPVNSMLISMSNYNNGGWYYSNNNGLFGVALPGSKFTDYSVSVSYSDIYTDADNNVFVVGSLTLGEDAKTAKAVVVRASDDAEAVADAVAEGSLAAVDVSAGRIEVPIADGLTGNLQLVVTVIDENEVKSISSAEFEYYVGGAAPWKSIGTGIYVDDFVVPLFSETGVYTYEVEIEESTETPGLYRIVNAYAPVAEAFGEKGGNKSIEIHAEDPAGVYILQQSIGLDFGYGDMSIVSEGGRYVETYGYETVKNQRPDLLGTLENGIITFPVISAGGDIEYQGVIYMGESSYYGGTNGAVKIYLPSALQNNAMARSQKNVSKLELNFNENTDKKTVAKHAVPREILKTLKEVKAFKHQKQSAQSALILID